MNTPPHGSFSAFAPIGLDELNSKAEMLARIDNKYILRASELHPALNSFADIFDVLDIEGIRAFSYSTIYFDDAELRGYYDHHQRRRKRLKARVRSYVDAGLHFLEVKLNDRRSTTLKKRLRIDAAAVRLDEEALAFIDCCHQEVYEAPFRKQLSGAIHIRYQRYTLVAKDGGERMTLDTGMTFSAGGVTAAPPSDMFIVETKSARGNGIADKILRSLHVQPTKRVSKYCIGLAACGQVARHNGFLPAMRRLGLAEWSSAGLAGSIGAERRIPAVSPAPGLRPLISSWPALQGV